MFLCPTAFRLIFGVSGHKLHYSGKYITDQCATSVDVLPDVYVKREKNIGAPKKAIVRAFLDHTYDELSIPVNSLNLDEKRRYAIGTIITILINLNLYYTHLYYIFY